jgi:hypothetical protein
MAGEPQRGSREPRGTTGKALASVYAPDRAADETLDRLIEQLGQVPWPKAPVNEGNRSCPS